MVQLAFSSTEEVNAVGSVFLCIVLIGRQCLAPHIVHKAAGKHDEPLSPPNKHRLFCTHGKMYDHEIESLDRLTERINAAQLEVSDSDDRENGVRDTKEGLMTEEKPSLPDLAGELQNLIIINLHPSAAIALSQTNHHFNSCANLHQLPSPMVFDYLQEKEILPAYWDNYACYNCLRLKPRSSFATKQTRSPRGKGGRDAYKRICLECGFRTGKHIPGQNMKIGTELQVYCGGCETLQRRFCSTCRWCESCIRKGTATVLRKGEWAGPNGEASEVVLRNTCQNHTWEGPEPVSGASLSIMQMRAMYEFEQDTGMIASPEWFDGPDYI